MDGENEARNEESIVKKRRNKYHGIIPKKGKRSEETKTEENGENEERL